MTNIANFQEILKTITMEMELKTKAFANALLTTLVLKHLPSILDAIVIQEFLRPCKM